MEQGEANKETENPEITRYGIQEGIENIIELAFQLAGNLPFDSRLGQALYQVHGNKVTSDSAEQCTALL